MKQVCEPRPQLGGLAVTRWGGSDKVKETGETTEVTRNLAGNGLGLSRHGLGRGQARVVAGLRDADHRKEPVTEDGDTSKKDKYIATRENRERLQDHDAWESRPTRTRDETPNGNPGLRAI